MTATLAPTEDLVTPAQPIGYGALPGGLHAASAETLPKGVVQVSTLGGFGWRKGLLGEDHRFGRGIGNLAIAFAPTDLISIALSLDGRYDKHFGTTAECVDDCNGYVGDPRLLVRFAKAVGNVRFGGQLGVWVPGKDAPSVAGSAISVDARGLIALKAGPGWLSFNAGFRVDNSAKSVDDPTLLSIHDRVSLGVSEFNAAVGGVHLSIPAGDKAFINLESSIDYFIGDGATPMGAAVAHEAPGPLIRFGASVGFNLTPQYALLAFVQGAKVPGLLRTDVMENDIRLIPYEPAITGGLGFQARFGGPKAPAGARFENVVKNDVAIPETADASGVLLDEGGRPIVGAKVSVKLKNTTGVAVSDDKGQWVVEKLSIGKTVGGVTTLDDTTAEISIDVSGKKPATRTVVLVQGLNTVETITLDPILPPGQLRAVVRSVVTGKPVPGAKVTIEPGGVMATSEADGTFSVDLPPGQYKITVSSTGLKDQTLDVTIDPNGVAIKNIELSK